MRLRLNGWQRLWVVVASLWLLGVLVLGYVQWPALPSSASGPSLVPAGFIPDATSLPPIGAEVPKALQSRTYTVTGPNGKSLDITSDHLPTEAELNDIFAKTAGFDPKRAAAIVRQQRTALAGQLLALWAIPAGLVYALGWSVGWVRRGFQPVSIAK